MQTPQPIIKLTKTDAARCQLETAIKLWFEDGDAASIHTLTAAAHQVLHDLGATDGKETMLRKRDSEYLRPEFQKEFHKGVIRAENFLKHADKSPDEVLELKPLTTPIMMLDAVVTYEAITGDSPPVLKAFAFWMFATNPEGVAADDRAKFVELAEPLVRGRTKQEFFTEYLAMVSTTGPR